ncbi:MAG: hypothetical protein U0360_02440 [Dehalococcoidia bacterium]
MVTRASGRALEVTDPTVLASYWAALGRDPMEAWVFRADLDEAVVTTVAGDELVIDSWRPGETPRQVRRK